MPARSISTASLTFGLVSIPVRLFPATSSKSVSFHLLHAKDMSRIQQKIYCPKEDKIVDRSELVRGYEVEKDQYVIISDDELAGVAPEKSTSIEIQEFVVESDISSLYLEKPYYLEPDKGAGKAYALLREALAKSGKVGVAQFVLRNRESLCVLKPQGEGLVLNALRFAADIRSMEELSLPTKEKLSTGEVSLATKLIEGMTGKFDSSKYKDTYTEEVRKLIEAKAKGEKRQAAAPKPAKSNVIDLVAALQESLGTVKKGRKRTAA